MPSFLDSLGDGVHSSEKLYPHKEFSPAELEEFFARKKPFPSATKPPFFVKVEDLNNSADEPYINKPKPAIEIGVNIPF